MFLGLGRGPRKLRISQPFRPGLQTWPGSKVGLGSRTYGIEIKIFEAKIIFGVNSNNNLNDRLW